MKRVALLLVGLTGCGACSDSAVGPGGVEQGVAISDGVELRFVVDFPEGEGPFPTVVYGPGSGNVSANHASIRAHAEELVRLGFAVVRYDKRGVGASEGTLLNLSTANSATVVPQLADDMLAVLGAAKQLDRVDGSHMALFGASQANWYMPQVAADAPEVRFMIVLTGGFLPVGPKNEWERLVFVEDRDPFAEATLEEWRQYDGPTGYDQRPVLRGLNRPLLYLLGGRDPGVPIEVMVEEGEALQDEGLDLTLRTFEDGRHLLPGVDFWPVVETWLNGL